MLCPCELWPRLLRSYTVLFTKRLELAFFTFWSISYPNYTCNVQSTKLENSLSSFLSKWPSASLECLISVRFSQAHKHFSPELLTNTQLWMSLEKSCYCWAGSTQSYSLREWNLYFFTFWSKKLCSRNHPVPTYVIHTYIISLIFAYVWRYGYHPET